MTDSGKDSVVSSAEKARPRITPLDRSRDLLPWRRAKELTRCYLYWLPVSTFPIPRQQRDWLMQFLTRWIGVMKKSHGLRPEVFLQYKTIYPDLMKPLLNTMMDFIPLMGLGRKPGAPLPVFPSSDEVKQTTKEMFDALKRGDDVQLPDTRKHMPDYSYWFLDKSENPQRELFFGHGGMTITFLKPDPKTSPPPLLISPEQQKKMPMFQHFDVNKMWLQANSLAESFLPKSKEFFGAGLEKEPQMKGIPFILPMLDSADFFSQPPEIVEKCFQLFEVYIRESPADKGLLLSFNKDMEQDLIDLLREMKNERLMYPEG